MAEVDSLKSLEFSPFYIVGYIWCLNLSLNGKSDLNERRIIQCKMPNYLNIGVEQRKTCSKWPHKGPTNRNLSFTWACKLIHWFEAQLAEFLRFYQLFYYNLFKAIHSEDLCQTNNSTVLSFSSSLVTRSLDRFIARCRETRAGGSWHCTSRHTPNWNQIHRAYLTHSHHLRSDRPPGFTMPSSTGAVLLLLVSLLATALASDSDHKVRVGSPMPAFSVSVDLVIISHSVCNWTFSFLDLFVFERVESSSFYPVAS